MGVEHTYVEVVENYDSSGADLRSKGNSLMVFYPFPHRSIDDEMLIGELCRTIEVFMKRHTERRSADTATGKNSS